MPVSNATRIVSVNLLVSASRALSEQAYKENDIRTTNFRDLCTLINLSVLYDGIEVLGSAFHLDPQNKPNIAAEYKSIGDITGLDIKIGPEQTEFGKVISEACAEAGRLFLNGSSAFSPANLKEYLETRLHSSLRTETSDVPDYWGDFDEGKKLALGGRSFWGAELSPGKAAEDFWYRTFLYVGFARTRKIPFVPDTVRVRGLGKGLSTPHTAYDELVKAVQEKWGSRTGTILDGTPVEVPPFAAVVFRRAGGDRSKIEPELRELREEFGEIRLALNAFESQKQWGAYRSHLQSLFAPPASRESTTYIDRKVNEALANFRKMTMPMPPALLKLRPLFSIIYDATSLFYKISHGDPAALRDVGIEAIQSIHSTLAGINEFRNFDDTNVFAEVHYKTGWDLRTWFNADIALEKLFGTIREDMPQTDAAGN